MVMSDLREILSTLRESERPKLVFLWRPIYHAIATPLRLGVFSGSFNPPTVAHVRLCEKAQECLNLHEVLLLLAIVNVDKTQFDFSLEERVEMMLAVAREHSNWSVALCSHGRFVEKACAVREAYRENVQVWFIVGYDTLVRIFEPRFYRDMPMDDALKKLFGLARLAVFPRGEVDETKIRKFLQSPQVSPFAWGIDILPAEPSLLWVSSTLVREKLKQGEKVDELVPASVLKFLRTLERLKSEGLKT